MRQEIAHLYEEHVWGLRIFSASRVGARADAEALTRLTFERALCAWSRFDSDRGSARTWLISIASNLLIDHYRRDRSTSQKPIEEHLSRLELITEIRTFCPISRERSNSWGKGERELIHSRHCLIPMAGQIAGLR